MPEYCLLLVWSQQIIGKTSHLFFEYCRGIYYAFCFVVFLLVKSAAEITHSLFLQLEFSCCLQLVEVHLCFSFGLFTRRLVFSFSRPPLFQLVACDTFANSLGLRKFLPVWETAKRHKDQKTLRKKTRVLCVNKNSRWKLEINIENINNSYLNKQQRRHNKSFEVNIGAKKKEFSTKNRCEKWRNDGGDGHGGGGGGVLFNKSVLQIEKVN